METVTVRGTGPRAQRILKEMEIATLGVTMLEDQSTNGHVVRRYRVEAESAEDARSKLRVALRKHGAADNEFAIE